jgi:tetratricopeptide (TPR) repeat protein
MAEAEHMVALNREYEPRGVRIVGISLDSSKAKMMEVCREKGFSWPQYFDGKVWENAISTEWGVTGIPILFLISPDGAVLWKGNGGVEKELEKFLKSHPPRLLDAKQMAEAGATLDKVEKMISGGEFSAAIKSFGQIPGDARGDSKLGPRIEGIMKQLEEHASKSLEEAEKLIDEKKFGEAVMKLRDVGRLTGLPAAEEASKRAKLVLAMPEAKAQIEAAERAEREKDRAARADEALAVARKSQEAKKDEHAYNQYKAIVSAFANTPAAAAAKEQVKKYEQDAEFVKRVVSVGNENRARSVLNLAANYKEAGRMEQAKEKYQAVIDQYPGTKAAEEAKKELNSLK